MKYYAVKCLTPIFLLLFLSVQIVVAQETDWPTEKKNLCEIVPSAPIVRDIIYGVDGGYGYKKTGKAAAQDYKTIIQRIALYYQNKRNELKTRSLKLSDIYHASFWDPLPSVCVYASLIAYRPPAGSLSIIAKIPGTNLVYEPSYFKENLDARPGEVAFAQYHLRIFFSYSGEDIFISQICAGKDNINFKSLNDNSDFSKSRVLSYLTNPSECSQEGALR